MLLRVSGSYSPQFTPLLSVTSPDVIPSVYNVFVPFLVAGYFIG